MSLELTKDTFDHVVTETAGVVLVDFWAPWCGPCKIMSPVVDELAGEMEGMTIAKVNVDEQMELAAQYNILSIPTFILFKGGQVIDQFSGSMTKGTLKEKIEKHLL
ncbi:MAG: thioredoxin [Patescibacteria group bacterium]